ncbi:unnamed protein product [Owenia fusiformis]|uniref:Phospholipase B-like n=1 Tax=Owenia fusiformis TaxID=6347 RepID=A0A8J1U4P3_OWEFU|nr:unnamed protein product [Owenia fusiformis]
MADVNFKVFYSFCLFLWVLGIARGNSIYNKATVYMKNGKASLQMGVADPKGAAYGYFKDGLQTSGWGILDIKAGYGQNVTSEEFMFAAGYIEAALTFKHIHNHFINVNEGFILPGRENKTLEKLKTFMYSQDKWTRKMISSMGGKDPYWRHVSYVQAQFDGLVQGYIDNAKAGQKLDDVKYAMLLLNGVGDLIDLLAGWQPADFWSMTSEEMNSYFISHSHCSALVKVMGAYENIFMSHSSWFLYSATNRIYKHYDFNLPDTAAKQMSFSSYPGFLESLDDFYLLSSKLVMLQTTTVIFNTSLYQYIVPESLLAWQRVRVANMMAHSGAEWAQAFKQYNSGTYNNQYMIVDLKKVHLNEAIDDGALWVIEQIPTLVEAGDQTAILRAGYWPSYNVPFYEKIYNMSDYAKAVEKFGDMYSYQLAPRAKIFRRDQGSVKDLKSMKHIMRYNDYQHDPYAGGDPCGAICCRGDLNAKNPRPSGCYDTKVADYNMAMSRTASIINGPTLGTGLKPFSWVGGFNKTVHVGLPQKYNFPFIETKPSL